jgi:hypothetical protein
MVKLRLNEASSAKLKTFNLKSSVTPKQKFGKASLPSSKPKFAARICSFRDNKFAFLRTTYQLHPEALVGFGGKALQ